MKRSIVYGFIVLLLAAACASAGTDGSDSDQSSGPRVTIYRVPT